MLFCCNGHLNALLSKCTIKSGHRTCIACIIFTLSAPPLFCLNVLSVSGFEVVEWNRLCFIHSSDRRLWIQFATFYSPEYTICTQGLLDRERERIFYVWAPRIYNLSHPMLTITNLYCNPQYIQMLCALLLDVH